MAISFPNQVLDRYAIARQAKPNTDTEGPDLIFLRPAQPKPDDVAATLSCSTPKTPLAKLGREVQVEVQLSNTICISLASG